MVQVKKEQAGSDSYGHQWDTDGAVIDIPEDEARALVAIPDGGFAIVEPATDEAADPPATEPARTDVDESPPPSTRRAKTKASDVTEA